MTDKATEETGNTGRKALWIAIGVTIAGLIVIVPALLVAAFVLWGIGEQNYPPPFASAPLLWVSHFFSIAVPLGIPVCVIAVWVTFFRKRYRRTYVWALISCVLYLLWLPGLIQIWS